MNDQAGNQQPGNPWADITPQAPATPPPAPPRHPPAARPPSAPAAPASAPPPAPPRTAAPAGPPRSAPASALPGVRPSSAGAGHPDLGVVAAAKAAFPMVLAGWVPCVAVIVAASYWATRQSIADFNSFEGPTFNTFATALAVNVVVTLILLFMNLYGLSAVAQAKSGMRPSIVDSARAGVKGLLKLVGIYIAMVGFSSAIGYVVTMSGSTPSLYAGTFLVVMILLFGAVTMLAVMVDVIRSSD